MLVGDTTELPAPLTRLSTTGLLRHESADALHDWISACVAASLVSVSNDRFRTLSLRSLMQTLKVPRPPWRPLRLRPSNEDDDDDDSFSDAISDHSSNDR